MSRPTPPTTNRLQAQRRADDIRVFREEFARLADDGVLRLPDDQRQAVDRHHDALLATLAADFDIDRDVRASQLSLGMRIASFIGAMALAACVFFLFRQFWGELETPWQVVILVGAGLGSFLATMAVDRRDGTGHFTNLMAMVAFACFVLDISMLGQIFAVTPSDKALLPWSAYALLLAYAFDLRLLQAAGILCLVGFIAARTGTWGGSYWIDFGERPENFFPAAFVIFALPQVVDQSRFAGFAALYRLFGLLALFLPMLVLANWGDMSYLDLDRAPIQAGYQTLGFAGTAAATWYGARRQWREVTNTGVTLFVVFFYSKLFDWWWESMPKSLFFLVMSLTAVLLLLVLRRLRRVIA